jgi:hypothetical protein
MPVQQEDSNNVGGKVKDKGVRDSPNARQIIADLRKREMELNPKKGQGMRGSDAFPSAYLAAEDLNGKTVSVTISGYRMFKFPDKDKEKLILKFSDNELELVCNITNANMIAEVLGTDEMDEWKGKTIELRAQKVPFGGKIVDAIRVQGPA